VDTRESGFATRLVHAGALKDEYGSVVPPIYQTSTFAFDSAEQGASRFAGESGGYIYTRIGNPTVRAFEDCIAALEGGIGAIATSSGMAAVTTAFLALLRSGDHVVSTASVYGPSRVLLERHLSRYGVASSFVDTSDLAVVRAAIRPETRMVYVETPSNPMMQVTNIHASPSWRTTAGPRSWWTAPSRHRTCSARSNWVPTWSSIRSRSSSTGTPTSWAGSSSRVTPARTTVSGRR